MRGLRERPASSRKRDDLGHCSPRRRGARPRLRQVVSVGNEPTSGSASWFELLAADPGTRVILLVLETVRGSQRLASAVEPRIRETRGRVQARPLGRSARRRRCRTRGALAGTDAALDAYFRDCGIVRVDMLETLLEIPPLVAGRCPLNLQRPGKVSVVTTTGGGAASVVDRLGMLGVELAAPVMDLTMAATGQGYGEALVKAAQTDCTRPR